MAQLSEFASYLREWRGRRGWSQEDLARRSGLSRAGVSAIETGRLVPSAAAALALAAALECRVEDLFRLRKPEAGAPTWAWTPRREPCRYWTAELGGEIRLYPAEPSPLGMIPHDGVVHEGTLQAGEPIAPERTLIMACCDPAVGLLAAELAREAGVRLLAFQRPSRTALTLLGQGLVHAAGVHLSRHDEPGGNAGVVRAALGPGYTLLRVAHWEEGIALAPGLALSTVGAAIGSDLRWIGRETGSGARQCLDELLTDRQAPNRLASDHRGVAEALRGGWADAGVCLRLVSEEAGLDFLGVRQEAYDLCFPTRWEDDPRLKALVHAVRSPSYRQALGDLPGYDSTAAGALQRVS
ncbi:substrate-binding domain-containing protein [Singulisphaera acidiphila]|uniref:Periplasmic molybdate-binding protein/domain protein n=2 Tax=Singulisphaera acidiphila TaxID=466153 RepID=L0DGD8_SINAD|nr:substrate-binding domain-containing protein [Singulisphaera acidiphila]AGA27746.1 periplasmic molybdate-binding protein/domain protein [Singulisphaera acidiphila DSM 18658]